MLSERFGISSQNRKRHQRFLKYCLLTGWFVSLSCLASTNEDLSEPPAALVDHGLPLPKLSAPQIRALPEKPQETRSTVHLPTEVTPQTKPQTRAAPVATPALPVSTNTSRVPDTSAQQLKAGEIQIQTKWPAATTNDSVSLKIMAARAEAILAELQAESDAIQIAVPFPHSMAADVSLQSSMTNLTMPETATPVSLSGEAHPEETSGMDWQRIRAQLEGHERGRRYEKLIERDTAFEEGPSLHDVDLRLPPMD